MPKDDAAMLLQDRIVESETLRAQSQAIQQQHLVVVNTLQEITVARTALENMSELEDATELLVPLGGGAFINAKLGPTSKIILNLGANIMAEKSREEAIKIMNDQINQLADARLKLEDAMRQIENRMALINLELQSLISTAKR